MNFMYETWLVSALNQINAPISEFEHCLAKRCVITKISDRFSSDKLYFVGISCFCVYIKLQL